MLMTGCNSNDLNLVAYDGKDSKSTIKIANGKGELAWAIPGDQSPTIIQIESVDSLYPEFFGDFVGKNHYEIRIKGYGSVMSLARESGGYVCMPCASISKEVPQVHVPVLWVRERI